jgi:hypothetical protein
MPCISMIVMGAGILVGIAFFSLAGYIARLAVRGLNGHDTQVERQRPLRHQPPAAKPRNTA